MPSWTIHVGGPAQEYSQIFGSALILGTLKPGDTSEFRYEYGNNIVLVEGSFTVDGSGLPTGGTVYSFGIYSTDTLIAEMDGYGFSVATLLAAITAVKTQTDGGALSDLLFDAPMIANGSDGDDILYAGHVSGEVHGNGGKDTVLGSDGDDFVSGGAGRDKLIGQDGEDTADYSEKTLGVKVDLGDQGIFDPQHPNKGIAKVFVGGKVEDRIVGFEDLDGGTGNDSFKGNGSSNHFYGDAGRDKLFGLGGKDILKGGIDNDRLSGGAGDDQLRGGDGHDKLTGGGGKDQLVFDSALVAGNVDKVTDFKSGVDLFVLKNSIFIDTANGYLPDDAFHVGAQAADAEDRIVYNKAAGTIAFDHDGVGGDDAIVFAKVAPGTTLVAHDFFVGFFF